MPILSLLVSNWKLVVLGLMLAAIGIQTWRLDRCHKGFAEYRATAEIREKALGETINVQNRAVAALETESKNRIARAEKGRLEALRMTQGARNEAERLRGLAKATQAPSACPAGQAVEEIRRGLNAPR